MSSSALLGGRSSWVGFEDDAYSAIPSSSRFSQLSHQQQHLAFPADPEKWSNLPEPDDALHQPKYRNGKFIDDAQWSLSSRGVGNILCISLLFASLMGLFVGYPVVTYFQGTHKKISGYNLGGINATGQVPDIGNHGLIDSDTPQSVYTIKSLHDGRPLQLVFSDEFNSDGRSFYPGDDPYWEAVDLHYWGTRNLEWYDPAAITTEGGALVITLSEKQTHGMDYEGGMITTWNKFCFTGGYFEAAVTLPGASNVAGLWPAIWSMGNLGRAGYGASLEGLWPYTYDSCDVGTAPNQTIGGLPASSLTGGDESVNGALSYLPGQRLSRCTCPDDTTHPGPKHPNGEWVGRAAPEIDMFEAQNKMATDPVTGERRLMGEVSLSAQWAPFNAEYKYSNTSENRVIYDPTLSVENTYLGGSTQQATSTVTITNQECYELASSSPCFSVFGFEYTPGYDNAYITWISDSKKAWTLYSGAMGPDPIAEISQRGMSLEPMYLIINLGLSKSFGTVDFDHLVFPAKMKVDYIRVYQESGKMDVGCEGKDGNWPTQAYIER